MVNNLMVRLVSSQERIFFDTFPEKDFDRGTALKNEPFSFCMALKAIKGECSVSITAECDGIDISVYKIGVVPVLNVEQNFIENGSENRGIGIYPDILLPKNPNPEIIATGSTDGRLPYYEEGEKHLINISSDKTLGVWFTINEDKKTVTPGKYSIKIRLTDIYENKVVAEKNFNLEIIDSLLPETNLKYTNWFHYDCLADIYNIEVFSDEYFSVLERFLKQSSKNGMNMILTPAFTPPLDTARNGERMCVQLVKINVDNGKYSFDFSLLEKFMTFADKCGLKYFEHNHLFSQWGAEHCPNIYATVDGEYKRIFGWETDAFEGEYEKFLKSYIPELLNFTDKLGFTDRLFFHISDEPTENEKENYKKAVAIVKPLIKNNMSGDALSRYEFYEEELVKTPSVSIAKVEDFFNRCDDLWVYYTGGYYEGSGLHTCTNRTITSTPPRARVLGLHMFKYKAVGFLHWAYNFYYGGMSKGVFNPLIDAKGTGAQYLVYPSSDKTPLGSMREKYMCEAMNDYRALKLLESFIGYDSVMELCEEYFGQKVDKDMIPASGEIMIGFREMINAKIREHI